MSKEIKEIKEQAVSEEYFEKQTPTKEFLKRLAKNKLALTGGIIFLVLVLISIFADKIAPYDYMAIDTANKFARPSLEHLFGTDEYGRDIFSRVVYGGRWSLTLGIAGSLFSTFFAIIVGSIAGYFGGIVDTVIMRIIDILQCIPPILLTICISTVLGPGLFNTVIAMGFGGIWGGARMLRGQILTVRGQEYVEAAKATNVSQFKIIVKYVLPNSIQSTIVGACSGIGGTIMSAAGLSFLGLGVQPPTPEWGAMLSSGRLYLRYYPNMLLAPIAAIAITVLSISLFGDGLRDAMDPRLNE
jgi:peptide/nickel transport system permease protein